MSTKPIDGFITYRTHHCITGSMYHIYSFNLHYISEDLLLGIGSGVSYAYWHFKGQPPFLGGRNLPKPSMEEFAEWFRLTSEKPDPAAHLRECTVPLETIAEKEESAWSSLQELVT